MSATLYFPSEIATRDVDLVTLSDDQLVKLAYEFAQSFEDPISDTLYRLFGEMFERWTPESEWRDTCARSWEVDGDRAPIELESVREAMMERAAGRLARLPIEKGGAS